MGVVLFIIGIVITYWVVQAAVLSALNDHYKTRVPFEMTGEWKPGHWHNKTVPKRANP